MIKANQIVFRALDEFCAFRGDAILNAGTPRWIATTGAAKQFLMNADLVAWISFSPTLKIARFDLHHHSYFVSIGFEVTIPPATLNHHDVDGGILTAVLADLAPTPIASTSHIRNIVEYSDKNASLDYDGHEVALISALYPKIQVFSGDLVTQEDTHRAFFLLALSYRDRADQWMDSRLCDVLHVIADLSPRTIPYSTLCRSILDVDTGALFLALYRCLESLYAHTQTSELMSKIGVSMQWSKMAQTLEESLGWYPREEASLEALLKHAIVRDLRAVADAMNETVPEENAQITAAVAKRIYQLRNALVHYRPFHRVFRFEQVDWNRLCESMALLVFHIYGELERQAAFQNAPVEVSS